MSGNQQLVIATGKAHIIIAQWIKPQNGEGGDKSQCESQEYHGLKESGHPSKKGDSKAESMPDGYPDPCVSQPFPPFYAYIMKCPANSLKAVSKPGMERE